MSDEELDRLTDSQVAAAREVVAIDELDASVLEGVPVIVADDVGRYVHDLGLGADIADAVATMAPPFDRFWVEFQQVPTYNLQVYAWGVLVETVGEAPKPLAGDDGVPRWVMKLTVIVELSKNTPIGPIAVFTIGLAEDGTWFRHADGDVSWTGGPPQLTETPPHRFRHHWGDRCVELALPVLMTISFMHCRNVKFRQVDPPAKLSKKHAKKRGRPLVSYNVLDIDPMREVLANAGAGVEAGSLGRALHIARGHFKVFTEDAPLFGSHVGTYWWSPHVRGKGEQGVVVNDYRVTSPGTLGHDYVEASEEPGKPPAPNETDPDAAGRGVAAHGATQNLVAVAVTELGYQPRSPRANEPLYDLAWTAGDATWVCEVKSLTSGNEERQLQRAIGQVIRYRQKLVAKGRDVQAVIVTEIQPADDSWDTLCAQEDIILAWPDVLAPRLASNRGTSMASPRTDHPV